jgi:hypothetical protein
LGLLFKLAQMARVDLLFRKIDVSLNNHKKIQDVLTNLMQLIAQPSRHLLKSHGRGLLRAGTDQINHRFGPGQVYPPVEKSP